MASTTKTTASAASMAYSAWAATEASMPRTSCSPAAGVDDLEAAARPLGLVGHTVASDTGLVLDDGLAAADDAVHQGRLADIGAADHGEDGQRAVPGRLDRDLDVLEVEALLRGELHELRVLGVAERPVVVLGRAFVGVRAVGLGVVVHEVRTSSFIVVVGGVPAVLRLIHYSVLPSAR
ncbi:hypothetical protein QFZ43_007257 [Streptomyces afghaniensis]|nr:hypothetical protein [Streptomyces afghaniensis]